MHQYKKLKIWQKAVMLSVNVYELTKSFPGDEKFGLTQQIRRSAVSIPSNIAEGAGRLTDKEFKYFMRVAYGSACELETQLLIADKLDYLNKKDYLILSEDIFEVQKMTYKFYESLM